MTAQGRPGERGLLVDEASVRALLVSTYGKIGETAALEFLAGGISSSIVRVQLGDECLVLKQALPMLRVAEPWYSSPERSAIEVRCARLFEELLPRSVPRVLREFPAQHAFAMTCAPEGSQPWKTLLLAGTIRVDHARRAGALLGDIHGRSAMRPE